MSDNVQTSAVVLAAGTPQMLTQYNRRSSLILQNTGSGAVTFGFGVAPTAMGMGLTLDPASSSPGQGGSFQLSGTDVPNGAIWALSAAGSIAVAVEGNPQP